MGLKVPSFGKGKTQVWLVKGSVTTYAIILTRCRPLGFHEDAESRDNFPEQLLSGMRTDISREVKERTG